MSTLGTMRTRIAREMKRGDILATDASVIDAIVSAIGFYENERFFFNEFRDESFSAVASTAYQTLTITPVIIDSVKALIGTRDYPLISKTWGELEAIDSGQFEGYPDYYAWHSDELRLYPPPNDSYTIKVSGVKILTEVSVSATNATSNAWTTDAKDMIRLHAKSVLWRDELRNVDTSKQFLEAAVMERASLKRRTTRLTGSGKLRGGF